MIRFLLIAIVVLLAVRLVWRVLDSVLIAAGSGRRGPSPRAAAVKLQRDPTCGTFVPPDAALSLVDGKTTFYFCSEQCRDEFRKRA